MNELVYEADGMTTGHNNQNWSSCVRCGQPVLIDPSTGTPQACASCESGKSMGMKALRGLALIVFLASLLGLLYFCVRLLYHAMPL